jgi:hypothetical protein
MSLQTWLGVLKAGLIPLLLSRRVNGHDRISAPYCPISELRGNNLVELRIKANSEVT